MFVYYWRLLVTVGRNIWGSIQNPYATYRRLVNEDPFQIVVIFAIIAGYFFFMSPIKIKTLHPFLLTINASRLFTTTLVTFFTITTLFYIMGMLFKMKPGYASIALAWGYSLVPTLLWFLVTSIMYVVLPPPRTETWPGRALSVLYLTFSLSLFFWKGILYYLTLRFALKLDLGKIIIISVIFFPFIAVYALLMYRLGIFRVPFI